MYAHLMDADCECADCGCLGGGVVAPGLAAAPPVQLIETAQAQQRATLEDFLDLVGKLALLINLTNR